MKNFGAVFNCKLDGEEFTASNRGTDMDEMLKQASAEHLMDDNDDTILNIKCTFKNKYQNENYLIKKSRTGASIATDKNDIVLLEFPVVDDIISIGSDDILATNTFIHAHSGNDDCWTLFNDEYNSKAQ